MKPTRVAVILMLAFLFGGSSAEVAVQAKRAIERHRASLEEGSAGELVSFEIQREDGEVLARPRVIAAPGKATELLLRAPGDAGMPLALSGVVYDTRGEIVPDAKVEIWQTDNDGHYDIEGYRYRALLTPGPKGSYAIESVMPGHYPSRVCQHVHYLSTAPGHKPLITQLYFATDPAFEGDPDKNYTRDPLIASRDLVRPVMIKVDATQSIALVTFDLVMERL